MNIYNFLKYICYRDTYMEIYRNDCWNKFKEKFFNNKILEISEKFNCENWLMNSNWLKNNNTIEWMNNYWIYKYI